MFLNLSRRKISFPWARQPASSVTFAPLRSVSSSGLFFQGCSTLSFLQPRALSTAQTVTMPKGVQDPNNVMIGLNQLRGNPGSHKKRRRVGRGPGSSKGKTAGRGNGGQNKRSGGGTRVGFEGGRTQLYKHVRKHGFTHAKFKITYEEVNLDSLLYFISKRRIDPSKTITMKTLYDAGVVKKVKHGVKILARGSSKLNFPLHIEASAFTELAKKAITEAGGTFKRIYYNRVALRYLLKPHKFALPVRRAVAPVSERHKFDDWGQSSLTETEQQQQS